MYGKSGLLLRVWRPYEIPWGDDRIIVIVQTCLVACTVLSYTRTPRLAWITLIRDDWPIPNIICTVIPKYYRLDNKSLLQTDNNNGVQETIITNFNTIFRVAISAWRSFCHFNRLFDFSINSTIINNKIIYKWQIHNDKNRHGIMTGEAFWDEIKRRRIGHSWTMRKQESFAESRDKFVKLISVHSTIRKANKSKKNVIVFFKFYEYARTRIVSASCLFFFHPLLDR